MKTWFLTVGILCLFSVATLAQTQVLSSPAPNKIFKEVSPAVVLIEVEDGTGSGFVVSTDGKIVTNFHVIEHTRRATVRLANGDAYDSVEVVDVDKRKDIAVLKIKAFDLPTVRLGESKALEAGTPVFSISNPLGDRDLKNTFSSGIVSGVRDLDGYHLIQITAAISPGSSGSPVLDGYGNVIGIAKGNVPGGQQLNFCIPIDYIKGLLRTTGTQPLSVTYTPPPPPTDNSTIPPPSPGPNPEPKTPVEPPPTKTVGTGPSGQVPGKKVGETIDGSWSATVADSKVSGRLDFNLIQNSDGQVVGTYTSSLGGGGSIKGLLAETDFRFELTQTIAGCPGIYKGAGTRIGDNIAGSYTGNDCLGDRGKGTFTMTRGTTIVPTSHATSSVSPVPDEMRKSVGDFLASRLLSWSEHDAQAVMGEPLSHRYAYDQARSVTGDIYTFRDPTLNTDHIELGFDSKTNRLTNVYLYPAKPTTWEDCKKVWGNDTTVKKNPDGTKFHLYKNRHVNVLLDRNDRVISLGLY